MLFHFFIDWYMLFFQPEITFHFYVPLYWCAFYMDGINFYLFCEDFHRHNSTSSPGDWYRHYMTYYTVLWVFFFFTMWTTLGTSCIHCFIHHNKITSIMQVTVFYLSFSMVLDLINKSKKWHLEKCCWRGKTCIAILFWLRMIFETISTILHQREVLLPFRLQTIKNLMLN